MGRGVDRHPTKGQTVGNTDLTLVDGSFWRIREKWNFKCRKECSFWLNVLPNDLQWLGHQRVSQFVIHFFGEFSTAVLVFRCRHLLCEVSGGVSLTQIDSVKEIEGGLRSQIVPITC